PFFVLLFYSLLFLIFFSPALLSGSLIGPADNVFYHQPYFYAEKVLWDTMLSSGFPMMADPQVMTFYPPALLFSLLPNGWNLFVISAYVLASCFTYGYVHTLTSSKLAGAGGGIIYGMSGFMVAQLDHASIVHNAAWLPLIIWSLEMLRRRASAGWFAAGCVGVACCALAGHSQIFVYSMVVSGFYVLLMGWNSSTGRLRFYSLTTLMFLLGVGLAAVQLIPTLELVRNTLRAEMSFQEFITYALPANQSLMILFPALFGGLPEYGREFYFGEWNLIELTGYVGLAPLLLAAVGFITWRPRVLSLFWLSVGVLAILLALGDTTPVAHITYRIPVINLFRVPARHFFELAFATSVLAGLGLASLLKGRASRALVLKTSVTAVVLMSLC
ncbi:MAG: YfhO family protein, partial [Acidobacteria bacterium]|nr:YfhO family protein [Acidobacteriota bacterium]